MAQSLRTFSPANVSVVIFGVPISGYTDGTFIEVERSEPNSSHSTGADGTVGLTKSADKTGTFRVTLMQNSLANLILAGVQATQDQSDSDLIRGPITVTDPSGSIFVAIVNAHIQTPPGLSIGKEQEPRVWEFFCETINYVPNPLGVVSSNSVQAKIQEGLDKALSTAQNIADEIG